MNFGGMGGMNMQKLMQQAQKMQSDMQQQAEKAEEELNNTILTGTSGGGMVEVSCTGKKVITGIKIKPEIVDPDDIEMLEDLVMTATNEALNKATELENKLKPDALGGLGL